MKIPHGDNRWEGLLLLSLLWIATTCLPKGKPFTIVEGGKPRCEVLIPQAGWDTLYPSAKDLQFYLREITGQEVPIGVWEKGKRGIVLATPREMPTEAKAERLGELGEEGFVIKVKGENLLILGNTPQGVQHGVFALLEAMGCRWFFPDPVWTIIPRKRDLRIDVDLREKPVFKWRNIWYEWGAPTPTLRQNYEEWVKHNRLGGSFPVDCGHAYERYIPSSLFSEHPEWFSLVNGKHQPTQLCVTNPEMQRFLIEKILAIFRQEPQRAMLSIEPNDGGGYCECEKCRALGSVSDQVFYLANIVAKAVRKEFPNKWVGLYAYAFHSEPPRFNLEQGVYVEITTGFRYTSLSFEEQVRKFRERGATLGVYDYFSVFPWDWDLPGSAKAGRFYELAKDIKRYHQLGFVSLTAESSCNWGPNGFGYWMASKLMWNPRLDPRDLFRDFCQKAFGRGAPYVSKIYERWAKGERFSPRQLKLSLLDLQEAYNKENDPGVRKRLNQLAMYLHYLRLWLDYEHSARWDEWGNLVNPPEEIIKRAHDFIVFSRRIMDTGVIHAFPLLFSEWFEQRFSALRKIKGLDWKEVEAWKNERIDVPSDEEVEKLLKEDIEHFASLVAVEIEGKEYKGELVPIQEHHPELIAEWGQVERSPLFVESGLHYFQGRKGEVLRITYTPFDQGHTMDCAWKLRKTGGKFPIAEGKVEGEKGKPATLDIKLPADGIYEFEPGTGYWKAGQIDMGVRPLSVWAGRGDEPGKPQRPSLRLWLPRNEPLYFFVPKGTKHFVLGIVDGGWPWTDLRIETADGTTVVRERLLSGDQVSVIVEEDIRTYGEASEMAKHAILPSAERAVIVPKGKDGQIWSLKLSSLRCVVELYDIPPYLSRHPAELLVPKDALGK